MFEEWIEGATQRDIGFKHDGIKQSSVSDILKEVRERYLGYAFEDVFFQTLEDGWTHGGKNTDDPDFINEEEEKKVISCKCFADKGRTVTIPFKELGKKEVELLDGGWDLSLVFYNPVWDEIFTYTVRGDEQRFTFSQGRQK